MQEQQSKVAALESALAQQKIASEGTAAQLQQQIETLTRGLQKVSDRVQLNSANTQVAASTP